MRASDRHRAQQSLTRARARPASFRAASHPRQYPRVAAKSGRDQARGRHGDGRRFASATLCRVGNQSRRARRALDAGDPTAPAGAPGLPQDLGTLTHHGGVLGNSRRGQRSFGTFGVVRRRVVRSVRVVRHVPFVRRTPSPRRNVRMPGTIRTVRTPERFERPERLSRIPLCRGASPPRRRLLRSAPAGGP